MSRKYTILLMFVPQLLMAQPAIDADGNYAQLYLGVAILAYLVVMLFYIVRKRERLNGPTGTHQGHA